MGLRGEFKQVAVQIFDDFGDVVVSGDYIQRTVSYIAGGKTAITDRKYTIRLIRDAKDANVFQSTAVNTQDVDSDSATFLTPASEMPVTADVKDLIRFKGNLYTIVSVTPQDAADALLTFVCVKQ